MNIAAQAPTSRDDAPSPRWHVGPYVGVARHSLVGTHLGVTPDRAHLFIGVHATASLVRTDRWTIAYAPEVVPLLRVSNNPTYRQVPTGGGPSFTVEEGRAPVSGFAMSPIGFEGQMRILSRWRAYTAGAAGVVWFSRAVPVASARAFNYTFEVGGGMLWRIRSRDSLRIGYKFHHLSNLYTAPENPGIDGAVFLAGFERAIGSRR
jgi:hypothetical protein